MRVIVDSRLRTPLDATVVQTAQNVPTIIATACDDDQLIDQYRMCGCTILRIAEKEGRVDLEELLQLLGAKGIDSVYVEGGATLHASLIEARLVNEIHAYIAPKIFGGRDRRLDQLAAKELLYLKMPCGFRMWWLLN